MISIPPKVIVRVDIEQGVVYNFSDNKDTPNHYFVVLNKNLKEDKEIYLVSFTTKKENALRHIKHFNLDWRSPYPAACRGNR